MATKKINTDDPRPGGDDPRRRLRQLRALFDQAVQRLEAIPESEVSEAGEPYVKECAEAVGAFASWFAELTPDDMCIVGDAWRVASALVGLAGVVDWIGLHWSVPFAHEIETDAAALMAEAEALDAAVTKAFTVEKTPNRLFMERRPLSEAEHDAIGEGIEKVALLAEALGGRLLRTAAWVATHPACRQPAPQPAPKKPPKGREAMSKKAKALAVLADHPDWTDAQVAHAAGCHVKSLYRWKDYGRARELLQQGRMRLPRGSKDTESGDLEAWEDSNDDDNE